MSRIVVTPLSAVTDVIRRHQPSHVITLLSPEHMIESLAGLPADRHLRLGLNDVIDAAAGENPPERSHVETLLDFSRTWSGAAPMLVHCWAGVSRSMAATYAILCDRLGPGCEIRAAQAIRARAPHAYPNALLVRYADELLDRHGHMIDAIKLIGPGTLVAEGAVVEFPLRGL
jgi:predicted protein tyrosine phosphatase